jgi:hypothetical protein
LAQFTTPKNNNLTRRSGWTGAHVEPDEIRKQLAEHDKRLAVVETRQATMIEVQGAHTRKLDEVHDGINDLRANASQLQGFLRGASWLLGIGFTMLGLVVAYAALVK